MYVLSLYVLMSEKISAIVYFEMFWFITGLGRDFPQAALFTESDC